MTARALPGLAPYLTAALLAVACGAPPDELREPPFEWTAALSELDDAALAVCAGADRLIAVGGMPGRGRVLEWRGDRWDAAALPADADLLWWCWIGDDGQALAVGEAATVLRSPRAGAWQPEPTEIVPPNMTLYGVWGRAPHDVYAVGGLATPAGNEGFAARFDGAQWRRVDDGVPDEILFKVWGAGDDDDDVWAVGTGGALAHFDGAAWTRHDSPTDAGLVAVWGTAADDVYAVGGSPGAGLVLRYDGAAWSTFAAAPERLSGVWTAPDHPLFVAGDRGYVARIQRTDPTRARAAIADPTVDLHSLTAYDERVIACGADLQSAGAPSWRGAVFVHGSALDGDVAWPPAPDAGPDAAVPDADAAATDASVGAGPGELCEAAAQCRPGLECWGLLTSGVYLCTKHCETRSECFEYGDGACCAIPGFQTLETVCIPAGYAECAELTD